MWTTVWPIACEGKSTENISAFLAAVNGLFVRFSVTSCVHTRARACVSAGVCRCCSYRWWITVDEGILTREQSAVLFADNSRAERHCCSPFHGLVFAKKKKKRERSKERWNLCWLPLICMLENAAPLPIVPYAVVPYVSYITMIYWRQKWEKDCNAMKF